MKNVALAFLIAAGTAVPEDRLPPLRAGDLTDAQRTAAAQFVGSRGKQVFGPFVPLLRSPELMSAAAAMGDYLRFHSTLSAAVREMAILLTCREWTQQYEWSVHSKLALEAGLRRDMVDAVADGRRVYGATEELEVAISLVSEVLAHKRVSDVTWRRALQHLGESGTVDLLGVVGYYSFLGVVLNAARTPAPDGAQLTRFPD